MKIIALAIVLTVLTGCSVSSLRCGVDEDRSYVELINLPQDIAGVSRHFEDLCGFAYEADKEDLRLNIIDQE